MLHHNTPSDSGQNGQDDCQRGNGQRGLQAAFDHATALTIA
jgi:hypothetical protein